MLSAANCKQISIFPVETFYDTMSIGRWKETLEPKVQIPPFASKKVRVIL